MSQQQEPKGPMKPQSQPKPGLDSAMDPKPRYKAPLYKGADKLKGKVALITGGDSGIGKAVAVLYAREGADVAIVYLPAEQSDAEETKAAVEAEGRKCLLLPGDVKDPKFCRDAVEKTVAAYGRLDVLVNNAAFQETQEKLEDITDEQFDTTFRTNVYGYFYMARAAAAHLPRGGAPRRPARGEGRDGAAGDGLPRRRRGPLGGRAGVRARPARPARPAVGVPAVGRHPRGSSRRLSTAFTPPASRRRARSGPRR